VVRRVLRGQTGPSGAPAMTDVLGVCTAWDDDSCVVEPESGPPVRIRFADIVSGKPVPPRPPVRHRVSPREAQMRGLALFPGVETEPLGAWLLRRSSEHPARRANSVLAFGPSGVDDDIDRVVAFYRRPVAAVLPDSAEEAAFLERGWVTESTDADTVFMIGGVARALRAAANGANAPDAQVEEPESFPNGAIARVGHVASGVAAYADDWVGFRSVEVRPDHRRQGLARAVMAALLDWGAAQGASTAYLQVLADNEPALALYESLGFTEHHTYRYVAALA
jgi:GNAT superfamily N-acetyltransferase